MAVARLGYEIDSSGAVKAAADLDKMSKSAKVAEAQQGALKSATAELNRLTGRASAEFIRLKASEDSAFAAAVKLKQAHDLLNAELKAGSITADQHAASLSNLSARYQSQIAVVDKTGRAYAGAGVNMRMLVPQLSQIGQQFTATGQLGQAVAVQAADIGLAFGVVGTVIGTVAGIALPSLIDALSGGESAADRFNDAMSDLDEAMGNFGAVTDIVLSDMDKLTEKYGEQASAVRALFSELVAVNKQQALNAAQASIIAAQDQFNDLERSLRDFADTRRELLRAQDIDAETIAGVLPSEMRRLQSEVEAAAQAIADDFNLTTAQAFRIVDALNAVEEAAGPEEAAQAAAQLASAIASAADEGADLSAEMANVASSAAQAFAAVQEVIQAGAQAQFAPGLNPTMNIPGLLPTDRQLGIGTNRRRGGGGRKTDEFARDLERLRGSLRTESEVLTEWKAEQDAILANDRAMEILGIEGHNEAKLRLEKEYQERLAEVKEAEHGGNLAVMSDFFGEAAGLMQSGNEKLFKIGKAAAVANAIVNGYSAAVAAWDKGMQAGGPPLAAAFTALSVAKTAAQISALKSASFGGGGGSGGGTSAGVTASAPEPQRQQTRAIISVQSGRSRFTIEELNDITRGLQDLSDDGVIIEGFTRA